MERDFILLPVGHKGQQFKNESRFRLDLRKKFFHNEDGETLKQLARESVDVP